MPEVNKRLLGYSDTGICSVVLVLGRIMAGSLRYIYPLSLMETYHIVITIRAHSAVLKKALLYGI